MKTWEAKIDTTPLKSSLQIVEKENGRSKVIIDGITSDTLAGQIVKIPVDMKVIETIVDYLYDKEKEGYLKEGSREDITHIFKHVAYLKERVNEFQEEFGELPSIEKMMINYKPTL